MKQKAKFNHYYHQIILKANISLENKGKDIHKI